MPDSAQFIFRFSLFALMHSVFAVPSVKNWCADRHMHLRRFYRLYYNIISFVLLVWMMAAYRNSVVLYVVPGVWSLVLYAAQIVFLLFLVVCVRQTGMAEFLGISKTALAGHPIPALVVNGWYGIVRHPLYLFSLLFLLSNPIISVRGLLLLLISTIYFLVGACLEEKRLLLQYGGEYRDYQRTVPFLIPRIFTRQS